ncbi:hypothetical protein J6590_005253 [Homalodisca vitripennis]|nr:hypothetical protein J6590_005253 [Homalodisca vitripennis]
MTDSLCGLHTHYSSLRSLGTSGWALSAEISAPGGGVATCGRHAGAGVSAAHTKAVFTRLISVSERA